jgi:hypothetical protein
MIVGGCYKSVLSLDVEEPNEFMRGRRDMSLFTVQITGRIISEVANNTRNLFILFLIYTMQKISTPTISANRRGYRVRRATDSLRKQPSLRLGTNIAMAVGLEF